MLTDITVFFIVAFSAFAQSFCGFGFALLAIPLLCLLLRPEGLVPATVMLGTILNGTLLIRSYKAMNLRTVLLIVVGSAIGLPFGGYVLTHLDRVFLCILINVTVIVAAGMIFLKCSRKFTRERVASPIFGFIGGALSSSTGLGGPPVILFGMNQGWSKEEFRANLIGYFTFMGLCAVPVFGTFGVLTLSVLKIGLIGLPGLALGFICGVKLKDKVGPQPFFKIATALVLFVAALGLLSLLFSQK